MLPPAEREARINTLVNEGGEYVLVCTDCLAEGINLQQAFDSVLHYDLCWNPTRHERREGALTASAKAALMMRVITYYGEDNPLMASSLTSCSASTRASKRFGGRCGRAGRQR